MLLKSENALRNLKKNNTVEKKRRSENSEFNSKNVWKLYLWNIWGKPISYFFIMDFCYSLLLFATPFYTWGFWTWLFGTTTPLYIPNSMCVRWILVYPVQLVSKNKGLQSQTLALWLDTCYSDRRISLVCWSLVWKISLDCWLFDFPIKLLENPLVPFPDWFRLIFFYRINRLICKNCGPKRVFSFLTGVPGV